MVLVNIDPVPGSVLPEDQRRNTLTELDVRGLNTKAYLRGLTDEEIRAYELRLAGVMVDYPKSCMGCCFVAFILLTFISFGVIGISISDSSFEDKGDERTSAYDAYFRLDEWIQEQPRGSLVGALPAGAPQHLLRSMSLSGVHMVYDGDGDNTLTLPTLRYIQSVERKILFDPRYKSFCKLLWLPPYTQSGRPVECPGADCPWYTPVWMYTETATFPGGAKALCSPPLQSLSWLMWNLRLVDPLDIGNATQKMVPCDVTNSFQHCVEKGVFAMLYNLDIFATENDRLSSIAAGGVEPTQVELDAFVKAAHRQMNEPETAYLRFFFDKGFEDSLISTVIRSSINMGGPIELHDPLTAGPLCHDLATETECGRAGHCKWVSYAGFYRNTTGCAVLQNSFVSKEFESSNNKDQAEDQASWFLKDVTDILDDEKDGPVDVLYLSSGTLFKQFLEIMMRDALLALISFFFVYVYIQIHTGSFFLASLGMLQVIMPFSFGYFTYRAVFGIKAFYALSSLSLFVVLAIGADDIFVLMDNWTQAGERPRHDTCVYLKGRFCHAWKSAATCMGITSLTTMCAFIATMSSPLADIGYFGLFAALLVFYDYVLVMTFFACAVVVYHRNSEGTVGCCCCGTQGCGQWCNCCTVYTTLLTEEGAHPACMETKLSEERCYESLEEAREGLGPKLDFSREALAKIPHGDAAGEAEALKSDKEYTHRRIAGHVMLGLSIAFLLMGFIMLASQRELDQKRFTRHVGIVVLGLCLFSGAMNAYRAARDRIAELQLSLSGQTIFTEYIAPFLSGTSGPGKKWYIRLLPALVLWALWIFMVSQAVNLQPTTKNEQWLPEWHPIQRFFDAMSMDFPSSDQMRVFNVAVMFGVDAEEPSDRSTFDKWDKDSRADPNILVRPNKQRDMTSAAFQEFAVRFCDTILDLSVRGWKLQRTLLREQDHNCFMKGLKEYARDRNITFPLSNAEYLPTLWRYTQEQKAALETRRGSVANADVHYDKVLFDFEDPTSPPVGVRAYILSFNTTLLIHGQSNSRIKQWYRAWEDVMEDMNEEKGSMAWIRDEFPTGFPLHDMVVQASYAWVWMHTQDVLVQGALTGTTVSLALATIVIFIGTLNPLIAILVLVELLGVVGYVLGVMSLLDWELGTIESVSITILVGLSVDYVVHFAVHYVHCDARGGELSASERQKRVHITAVEMGPTVLGGAATSAGAAIVLLLTWIQFFYKFGICFLFTIVCSYLWAMLFFLPAMSVIGPQDEFLSLRPVLARFFPRFFAGHGTAKVGVEKEMTPIASHPSHGILGAAAATAQHSAPEEAATPSVDKESGENSPADIS